MKKTMKLFYKKIVIVSLFILCFAILSPSANALTVSPVRFEVSADPGEEIIDSIILYNDTDVTQNLYTSYANFEARGESGTPAFLEEKTDLATWIKTSPNVVIQPGESKIVPFTIKIPSEAEPGGYFATIFFGTVPPEGSGSQLSIGAKTGVLVLLRVNGEIDENGGILEFATVNNQTFFTALPVSFTYRFQNSGSDRVKPDGFVNIDNIFGGEAAKLMANPVDGNVLPESVRRFEVVWNDDGNSVEPLSEKASFFEKVGFEWKNFAFGKYTATLNLSFGATGGEMDPMSFKFWVFPWHLIIFLIIAGIIVFFILKTTIKKYNKWIVSQAEKSLAKLEAEKSLSEKGR